MTLVVILVVTFFFSVILTRSIRYYAIKYRLLDIPNTRSSHVAPVPRMGGVAIVSIFFVAMIVIWRLGYVGFLEIVIYVVPGLLVAAIGLFDDRFHVSPLYRLFVHVAAAGWVMYWLGATSILRLLGVNYDLVWLDYLIALITLVWALNLFNFMDGIDGIAASETIFIAGSGFLFATLGANAGLQLVAVVLIGSTLGFLIWNWPPAKIFLGDVGSGFLGITLGIYAYWAMTEGVVSIWTWTIVFGVFLVDATFTLLRRFFHGLPWYQAHRTHAYQHAARRWGHLRVTLSVSLINLLWLLPIAYISNNNPVWGPYLALLALLPLLVLVFLLGAGREEEESPAVDS